MSQVNNFAGLDIKVSDKRRKELYEFRKHRREAGLDIRPGESDVEKTRVLDFIFGIWQEEVFFQYEDMKRLEYEADSAWFALSEIARFHEHIATVHKGEASECDGCMEDYTMEDSKDFMCTIVNYLQKNLEEEEAKNGI